MAHTGIYLDDCLKQREEIFLLYNIIHVDVVASSLFLPTVISLSCKKKLGVE